MGVADVSPARGVLLGAWFFGALFVWEILALYRGDSKRRKRVLVITLICLWTGVVYGLERWTTRWKMLHPTEIAVMEMELHEVATSVHQLTASKQTKEVQVTRNQPGITKISAVAGYLKIELNYPRLPVEQANKPASIDIGYSNPGSTYVHGASIKATVYYVDFHGIQAPPLSTKALMSPLKEAFAKTEPSAPSDVAPGDGIWNSYETSVLTEGMINAINMGTARIYLLAYAEWASVGGVSDHVNTCLWLQPAAWVTRLRPDLPLPDVTKVVPNWHTC
jgi:hypothetical protein